MGGLPTGTIRLQGHNLGVLYFQRRGVLPETKRHSPLLSCNKYVLWNLVLPVTVYVLLCLQMCKKDL